MNRNSRARKQWVRRMVAGLRPPRYGSREWLALPEGDRRKVAAVIVAAECWASEYDELPARLRFELNAARAATERLDAEDDQARWQQAVNIAQAAARRPDLRSYAERRAAELAAARAPWGNDYPGRGDAA